LDSALLQSFSLDSALLQSFLEALPDACVVIDSGGRVIAVNDVWRKLPRRKEAAAAASDPVGIDYLALLQSSTSDTGVDRAVIGVKAVLSGTSDHFEQEYIRPTASILRWFRMTVHAWQQQGTNAIIFHRDITSEKLGRANAPTIEQEFRALADSAPIMIWMSGPDKACIFVSRRWLEFTGARFEDQLGDSWVKLVHPDDRPPSNRSKSSPTNIACGITMAATAGSAIADRRASMHRTTSWASPDRCGI
jgi:PAS domain-containing protein